MNRTELLTSIILVISMISSTVGSYHVIKKDREIVSSRDPHVTDFVVIDEVTQIVMSVLFGLIYLYFILFRSKSPSATSYKLTTTWLIISGVIALFIFGYVIYLTEKHFSKMEDKAKAKSILQIIAQFIVAAVLIYVSVMRLKA